MAAPVVLSGLPGTGKSTVARRVVDATAAELFAKDVIEAALWRRGVGRDQDSSWVAHEVMTSLASEALRRGRTVVLDTVAGTEQVRRDWRAAAAGPGVKATRARWEAWTDPHLEVDAADDLSANATAVIDYLRAATPRTPRGVSRT